MNLLDLAKKKYWVDNDNDGKNDKYDYGLGGTGETDFEKESPEGTSGKGKLDIDCSHLVNNVLNEAGYNIPYETTSSMKNSKYYDPVSPNDVQPGDIVLFEGHVGFVASYDVNTKTGKFFGSQTSTGPAETEFSTDSTITNSRSGSPYYWGGRKKFLKFLRPKSFFNYPEKVRNNLKEGTRRVDPLVIDLDGDGIELRDIKESNAMFDLTGSGFANRVGWVSPDDGFLVWDRNGNGRVDDISEMFGNANQSGFQALSLYDTNRDGKIDAFDDVFKNLKIWQDRDGDGRTDERELKNLAELGIKAINLNTTHTNINQGGNQITEIGSVEKEDGTETQAGNVNFELDRLYSYYNREVILNPEIVGLPWVKGYGFMPDLPIAMSMDETLLQMVKDAVEETDLAKLKEKFEKIIFRWAGVENIREEELGISWAILSGNDRENRFLHFDGGITLSYEQVGAIIKFVGATPEEVRDGIRHRSGRFLLEAWNTMFQGLFTRFVVDAGLLEDILPAYYDFFTDRIILAEEFDTGAFRTQIKQMFLSDDPNQSVLATLSLLVLKEVNALDSVVDFYADENIFFKLLSSPYAQFIIPKLISGTQGNDWLYGTDGNDVIVGKEGNDNIYGNSGDDTLIGGKGNDYLSGGSGSDTYVFNRGDGQDTIYEYGSELNTIKFGEGISKEDVEIKRYGDSLVISIKGTQDRITIQNWYGYSPNFKLVFSDGTEMTREEIDSLPQVKCLIGTEGNDNISAPIWNRGETIYGLEGNDYLYGSGANDTLDGGEGNDNLYGRNGDDTLIGGKGNDYLYGYSGSDTYVFNRGDGQDTISEYGSELNTIKFGQGINKDDLEFTVTDDYGYITEYDLSKIDRYSLLIKLRDSDDSIRIQRWFDDKNNPRFQFVFEDGTVLTKEEIDKKGYNLGKNISYYPNEIDTVVFNNGIKLQNLEFVIDGYNLFIKFKNIDDVTIKIGDWFSGKDLRLQIKFEDGTAITPKELTKGEDGQSYNLEKILKVEDAEFIKDWNNLLIKFKNGEGGVRILDWFSEYDENFKLIFSNGKSLTKKEIGDLGYVIFGDEYDNFLYGSNVNDTIYGKKGGDFLYGGNGNDVLIGGQDNDYLSGDEGSDTYIFNRGDGQDTIYADNKDIIKFGEGISKDDLEFARNGYDLMIYIKDSSDRITIKSWFVSESSKINRIEFSDGSIITFQDIDSVVDADIIKGSDEDDTLYGTSGDDILIGGKGNDYLEGGDGDDTYVFNRGDGQDTIYINKTKKYQTPWMAWEFEDKERLVLGEGITKDDLEFFKEKNDLIIKIKNSDDSIKIKDYFVTWQYIGWWYGYPVNHKIDEIVFSDGTKLTSKEIEYHGFKVIGTSGNDCLAGYIGNDILIGYEGDDTLFANVGDDILIGGPGNDWLYGDDGSDTYIFNKGDGQDEIYEYYWYDDSNKTDIIKFGEGITKDDVLFIRDREDLIVEIKNSSDRIRIFSWFSGENYPKIDKFEFSDGTILTKDDVNNLEDIKLLKGTDGDDNIYGSYLDELIYGYGGNDDIYGEGGNDFIDAGEGDDYIYVQDGNSLIVGGKGNDYIYLYGNGEKIIEFNKGNGIDTVNLSVGDDWSLKVRFGEGITKDDINYQLKDEGIFVGLNNTEEGVLIKVPIWPAYSIDYGYYEYGISDYGLVDYGTLNWNEVYNLTEKITLEFKDGTVVNGSEIIESMFAIKGTDGDDILYGTQKSDILIGKKGNDYLNGGSGSDLYIFNPGDGQDIVEDRKNESILSEDVLKFKVDKENIVLFKNNDDLIIGYSNNDFVKVLDQFKDENSGIERIEVKDGYYITRWDIENIVNAMIDFNNDNGMSYMEKYNNLLYNQNFTMLLSQNWSKSWSYS